MWISGLKGLKEKINDVISRLFNLCPLKLMGLVHLANPKSINGK